MWMKSLTISLVLLGFSLVPSLPSLSSWGSASASSPPLRAATYQRSLIQNVQFVWGLSGPVATMAGQIEAESSWLPKAQSPYAAGLAQFTPSTADDISTKHPLLGPAAPFEPSWAFRALAYYDYDLWTAQNRAATPCDRWAFTLSAYNGGSGNLQKDKNLTVAHGADGTRWFGGVSDYSLRAAAAFKENRAYPEKILHRLQFNYTSWGPTVACGV